MKQGRMTRALIAGGMLWSAASGMAGCSAETRQKVLPIFFDGVPGVPGGTGSGEPAASPPTSRVRRDLLREIEELKRALKGAEEAAKANAKSAQAEEPQRPIEKAKTWDEAAQALPKDAAGRADWVQAVNSGAIAPHPGVDPKAPVQATLDLDVDLNSSSSKLFSATFPHSAHTQWLACGNCHPAIFPLKRGGEPTVVTMSKIQAGQQCGVCHGKVAFRIEGGCARCHTRIPAKTDWRPPEESRKPVETAKGWDEAAKHLPVRDGAPDWAKALAEGVIAPRPGIDPKAADQAVFPLDVELVPTDNPLFKVVFPHGAHTALLSCATCHPGIFQMAKGADPITMDKIYSGQYCGVCHGKVAFAVPTGCPRCHEALAPK